MNNSLDKNFPEIIKKIKENNEKLIAFYAFDHHLLQAEMTLITYKNDKDSLIFKVDKISKHYLNEIISGDNKINIYIPSKSLVMITGFKELDDNDMLTTTLPQQTIKFERRLGKRISPNNIIDVKIKIKDKTFSERCFDISTNGFSVITSNVFLAKLPVGTAMALELNLLKTSLLAKGSLISTTKVNLFTDKNNPYGGHRLAISFENLIPATRDFLNNFINEHSEIFRGKIQND